MINLRISKGFSGPIAIWVFLDTIINQDKKYSTGPEPPTTVIYGLVEISRPILIVSFDS